MGLHIWATHKKSPAPVGLSKKEVKDFELSVEFWPFRGNFDTQLLDKLLEIESKCLHISENSSIDLGDENLRRHVDSSPWLWVL